MLTMTFQDVWSVAPSLMVTLTALVVLLVDVFAAHTRERAYAGYLSAAGLLVAMLLGAYALASPLTESFGGMLSQDAYSGFFSLLAMTCALATILMGIGHFREHGLLRGEFFVLVLLATVGMQVMVAATDFLVFFVGLELMSLAVYALAAYERHRLASVEAAFKYFLMGAFASAFLLFGLAFLYGAAGSLNYHVVAKLASAGGAQSTFLFTLGLGLVLIGFGFKAALVPFHMWTPDAYEGAPTPVTAFMAAGVKAAAFGAFARMFAVAFIGAKAGAAGWYNALWVLAVLTMTYGNLVALWQDNIKRMLAYSAIAHAGYLVLGFLTLTGDAKTGFGSVLFYLVGYALMNLGAFAVVSWFSRRDHEALLISKHYAGAGLRAPALGIMLAIFLFSLAGIPGTVGFVGKYYLFKTALDQGLVVLALIAIVNSLISVYYYLRVIVFLFMVPPTDETATKVTSLPIALVASLACFFVLLLGVWPNALISLTQLAVSSLF